jgi:prepilin-type processing-associated H-X9-DG protein
MADPVHGPPNPTALATKIAVYLCPSDPDWSADPFDLGHVNYRGNAGTLPYNLAADSPDGTGRNNGFFWFQSAVRVAEVTDGTSNTALFSERCLGTSSVPDLKADYYMNGPNRNTCQNTTPGLTSRYAVPHELSGQRWGDGALFYTMTRQRAKKPGIPPRIPRVPSRLSGHCFYTRYNHIFPPNKPSCLLGGTNDYGCQVVVSASSRHPGGVNVATADGAVRFAKDSIDLRTWTAMGTIAEGEVVSASSY